MFIITSKVFCRPNGGGTADSNASVGDQSNGGSTNQTTEGDPNSSTDSSALSIPSLYPTYVTAFHALFVVLSFLL